MDKLFKAVERQIARYLGGERNPVGSGVRCDVSTKLLSVEVKEKQELPKWLIDAMSQAVRNCEENKIPVVILHRKGDEHRFDYLIIRLGDFVEYWGG